MQIKGQDRESHLRSLLKGLTWRVLGTGITMLAAWAMTREVSLAFQIGGVDFFGKLFFYYLHERAWLLVPPGAIRSLYPRRKGKKAGD